MIARTFFLLLIAFTLAACAQTKHRGSLSKYEKSVEFVENLFTDSLIKAGLQEGLDKYKEENATAVMRLSDAALDEINTILTREVTDNRSRLVSKIAILFTAEFTDAEINTLHSMKDINSLKSAEQKIKSDPDRHNLFSRLTPAEIKALSGLKNIKNLSTIIPKLDALTPKLEQTGQEFYGEILIKILPELLGIIAKHEPLISANLFLPQWNNSNAQYP